MDQRHPPLSTSSISTPREGECAPERDHMRTTVRSAKHARILGQLENTRTTGELWIAKKTCWNSFPENATGADIGKLYDIQHRYRTTNQ